MWRDGFEFIQNDAFGEQLRKHNRLRFARRVKHIQWDTRPSKLFQNFRDRGIGIRPIGFELDDPAALKCVSRPRGFENGRFVELAGQTPGRGEIDKDGVALSELGLETLRSERLPVAREWLSRRRPSFAALEFLADEIEAAADHEHEHEHEQRPRRLRSEAVGTRKAPFIQQARLRARRKQAGPDRSLRRRAPRR